MSAKENDQCENMKLLTEIFHLKIKLREIYLQTGPSSSNYITLKIKLDILIKEYMDEKFVVLASNLQSVEGASPFIPFPFTP